MFKLAFVTLSIAASFGCHAQSLAPVSGAKQSYAFAETRVNREVKGRPTFGRPIPISGSSTRIIPFSRETELGWFSDKDNFQEGGERFYDDGASRARVPGRRRSQSIRWHNAVLHDLRSGEQWTLLSERGVVSRYWMRSDNVDGRSVSRGQIFAVTATDSNGDNKLDDLDAMRALAVDSDGRNPRYVTPANTRLVDVQYDDVEDAAYLMVSEDVDGDGKFSSKEAPRPYLYRFGENRAEPLLEADTVERIESALR